MKPWNHLLPACLALTLVSASPSANAYHPGNPNEPPPSIPWTAEHLQPVYVGDGVAVVKEVDGRKCLETTGARDSRYLYFQVDDGYAFDVDETVELEIEYDSTVTGGMVVEYDSHYDDSLQGSYHATQALPPDKSKRWSRHKFTLDRARLASRQNGEADFRISSGSGVVRICGIQMRRLQPAAAAAAEGKLELQVVDASTGRETPARVGLYNAKGQFRHPGDKAVPINVFYRTTLTLGCPRDFSWPVKNTYAFYITGRYECSLPAGEYELVVRKGIEYRIVHMRLTVQAGRTLTHVVKLERWADMPARGWYSGDAHIHIGRQPDENQRILAQIEAEDVHVANLMQMGNVSAYYFRQYAWGEAGRYQAGMHVLFSGHEDPRTPHRGHTLLLNIKSLIHDDQTYFLYHKAFEETHRQGGLAGYAHGGEGFNAQRGMAVDVPFEIVDLIEVLQANRCSPAVWYEFLNLGYKLVPVAGSDFPYLDPPGAVRNFVHLDGPFSAQAWFKALGEGRTFVTNGPMLTFTVNGKPMGSELQAGAGDSLSIEATATINPDIDKLDRLDLVVHGETVKTVQATAGTEPLRLSHTLKADRSMWMAVVARCRRMAVAHTAPVYIIVDGKRFWKPSAVPELIAKQRGYLKDLVDKPVQTLVEHWLQDDLQREWTKQKPMIQQRVGEANARYDALERELPSR